MFGIFFLSVLPNESGKEYFPEETMKRKGLVELSFKTNVFHGQQKREGWALSDLCSYHRFDGTMVNPLSPSTRNYNDERFIFKDYRKNAFCRLISVYGYHCGGKTATKLGLVELVGFLHESQIYSWSVRLCIM